MHVRLLVLVVFFLGALAHLLMYTQTSMHILQLALCGGCGCGCIFMWFVAICACSFTYAGGDFPWSTSAFTNVHTNEHAHIATCTLWWLWLWLHFYVVVVVVLYMWWWLYVVVVAAHGGDSHRCVAVVVLLYDCICARWLWSIMNDDATWTINMNGCTLWKYCGVIRDYKGYTSS